MDERKASRVATDERVKLDSAGRTHNAQLHDLSVNGCQFSVFGGELSPGENVNINIGDLAEMTGAVVWANGGLAGVKFECALHEAAVRHLDLRREAYRSSRAEEVETYFPEWPLFALRMPSSRGRTRR